jgi:hypothetical protein
MENKDKKNSESDLMNSRDIVLQNIILVNKEFSVATNEEIAEQGFTIRDGHNPNKPNPDEKPIKKESDLEGFNDFKTAEEELKNPSEHYRNFTETEEVLEAIDDEPEEEDEMEGDEHERNHSDGDSEK